MRRTRSYGVVFAALAVVLTALMPRGAIATDQIKWTNIGRGGGGNLVQAAISPEDFRIIIAGSDTGGIYRSGDGGATWEMRNNALIVPSRASGYYVSSSITFDPVHKNIVYAGTLKSTDAGLTWRDTVPSPYPNIGVVTVDPSNDLIVYATSGGTIYRSIALGRITAHPRPFASRMTAARAAGPTSRSAPWPWTRPAIRTFSPARTRACISA